MESSGCWPLPDEVRRDAEALFGVDLRAVRLHVGPQARAAGARAFALGLDVFVAPEHYAPDTRDGRCLLGHELCHVVQQCQGRAVNPSGAGIAIVDDPALEAEAERAGRRLASGEIQSLRGALALPPPRERRRHAVLQRSPFELDRFLNTVVLSPWQSRIVADLWNYQYFLITPVYFEQALKHLEAQLQAAHAKTNSLKKILSHELANQEVQCGFNPGVNIYYKVLSEDAFKHLAEQRMQFKDVGAGFVHGEHTHRIQWYVCMYHHSRGFGDPAYVPPIPQSFQFYHVPAELFEGVNSFGSAIPKEYWPQRRQSGGGYLWDTTFDRNTNHVDASDGITCPEVFNKSLFQVAQLSNEQKITLGSSGIGTRSNDYPILSDIVTQRFLKRISGIKPENDTQLIEYAKRKYNQEQSKYKTLVDDMNSETLEKQLDKGVLIAKARHVKHQLGG